MTMNMIAVDIGNTNVSLALYLQGKEQEETLITIAGSDIAAIEKRIEEYWQQIPVLQSSTEKKRDGAVVASSVKPGMTKILSDIVRDKLGEKLMLVGKDIPYPIKLGIKEKNKVGSDRVITAAAAYAVTEQAVVIADLGTAVTIDLVDDRGVFCGGCIIPGFEACAKALNENTAQLPKIHVTKPTLPFGKDTEEAINCGLYYSVIGALEEIIRRYAEAIGTWPKTVITGSGAALIKDDCNFIDSYVPGLVVKGIALAYTRYIEDRSEEFEDQEIE